MQQRPKAPVTGLLAILWCLSAVTGAYGPKSSTGTFSDALMKEAEAEGWTVISMKDDWKTVFAFE